MKQFPNTFDKCLEEKKNLLNDVKLVLGTSKNYKTEKNKKRKRKQDKSGKSYDIITVYQFDDGAQMMASCINWSKKMKYSDMLDLSIMNKEYKEWNLKAYK